MGDFWDLDDVPGGCQLSVVKSELPVSGWEDVQPVQVAAELAHDPGVPAHLFRHRDRERRGTSSAGTSTS